MAAHLLKLTTVFKNIQDELFSKSKGYVRKFSELEKERQRPKKKKKFGITRGEFEKVKPGEQLYISQKLVFCPGLNVGVGGFRKLYAKVPGTVRFSCEKTNFKPDCAFLRFSYPHYTPPYKIYINVIPEPMHKRFKLIEKF